MGFSLDISMHRKGIDIGALRNEGLCHLYLKATEGRNYIDPCLDDFYNQAVACGVPVGYYHFLTKNPDVEGQAEDFYNAVKFKKSNLKYVLDMEVDLENYSDAARRFINKFEELMGKTNICCIYASGYYARDNFDNDIKEKYPLWIAHYKVDKPMETGFKELAGWQYSEDEYHGGQPCDSNIFYNSILIEGDSQPYTISINNENTIYNYEQHGDARIIVDELNVREEPSLSAGIVAKYKRDEIIYGYDRVYENDGYRWIRYLGSSGKYRYIAVRVLSTNERYAECY